MHLGVALSLTQPTNRLATVVVGSGITNVEKLSLPVDTAVGTQVAVSDGFYVSGLTGFGAAANGFYFPTGATIRSHPEYLRSEQANLSPDYQWACIVKDDGGGGLFWSISNPNIGGASDTSDANTGEGLPDPGDYPWASAAPYWDQGAGTPTLTNPALQTSAAPDNTTKAAMFVAGGADDGLFVDRGDPYNDKANYDFITGGYSSGQQCFWATVGGDGVPSDRWLINDPDSVAEYYSLSDVATPDLASNWKNASDDTDASITVTAMTAGEMAAGLRLPTVDPVLTLQVNGNENGRLKYTDVLGGPGLVMWDGNVWVDEGNATVNAGNVSTPNKGTSNYLRSDIASEENWIDPSMLLHVSSDNARYFANTRDEIVVLTGKHFSNNLLDMGASYPPSPTDFSAYLDDLIELGHNFIRLWKWDQTVWNCGGGTTYGTHFPYVRSGPGTAHDGLAKFDLTTFDQDYFDRLRQRVQDARDRNIYVSIMLFEGYGAYYCDTGDHPFASGNNINSVAVSPVSDVYSESDAGVFAMQKLYINKVVDTVYDLPNVLYEICNESQPSSLTWQGDLIDYLKSYEAGKPFQHPVGFVSYAGGGHYDDLYDSNADWVSPSDGDTAVDGTKVVILDNDHASPIGGGDAVLMWKRFLRGMNPIYLVGLSDVGGDAGALSALGDIRLYASAVDLKTMIPHGDLSSSGYALASSTEWLTYVPSGTVDIDLSAATSSDVFKAEWFSITDREVTGAEWVLGGDTRTIIPPGLESDMILYVSPAAPSNASWYRSIEIDPTKCGSADSTDFPVLVSGTYSYLKTVGNGGKVKNASGFDVIFYADAGLRQRLKWEVESYDPATGAVAYWVRVPLVSHTTPTTIYMTYGDAAISTDQSNPAGVWSNGFASVYHLTDGVTLSPADSLGAHNGTNHSATAGAGKIDGAAALSGTAQYIDTNDGPSLAGGAQLSCWFKTSTSYTGTSYGALIGSIGTTGSIFEIAVGNAGGGIGADNGAFALHNVGASYPFANSTKTSLNDGAWHYIVGGRNGSNQSYISVDGETIVIGGTESGTMVLDRSLLLGATNFSSPLALFTGAIDECRRSSVRSQSWITAEYNNQNSPSTFYTVGDETAP